MAKPKRSKPPKKPTAPSAVSGAGGKASLASRQNENVAGELPESGFISGDGKHEIGSARSPVRRFGLIISTVLVTGWLAYLAFVAWKVMNG